MCMPGRDRLLRHSLAQPLTGRCLGAVTRLAAITIAALLFHLSLEGPALAVFRRGIIRVGKTCTEKDARGWIAIVGAAPMSTC